MMEPEVAWISVSPAVLGAVKSPAEVIDPPPERTFHVTLFGAVIGWVN